jgi:hypothetical protein
MEEFTCSHGCCKRKFLPLTVAYARTIHKFQGLTAGPTSPGRPSNLFDVLVVDPDEKACEGSALGLLYTAISRGTTLGDTDGLNSAIYFTGSSMKPERIRNLTHSSATNAEFELARKRRHWVQYLESKYAVSQARTEMTMKKKDIVLKWSTETKYSVKFLYNHIFMYNTR